MFKTLILGPSNVHFSEPGREDLTTFNLLKDRIATEAPDFENVVLTEFLTYGERMAPRAAMLIEREQADVAFIQVGTNRIEDTYVVYEIRRRWPRLYPYAMKFAIKLKNLSGGGTHGGEGPRGLLFRIPRTFARLLIGAENGYDIDLAIQYTKDTIDAIARFEDRSVAIQLMPTVRANPSRSIRHRVDRFTREVRDHCAQRRVAFLSRFEYCRELGLEPTPTRQGVYPPLETRQIDAQVMAQFIYKAAAVKTRAEAAR